MSTVKFNIGGIIVERDMSELTQISESGQEIELKPEGLVTYKTEDFETFKTNLKKTGYEEGKIVGDEIAIKKMKQASGYDIEGYKDPVLFFGELKTRIESEAGKDPSEKLSKLQTEFDTLQENYKTLDSTFSEYKTTIQTEKLRGRKDTDLIKLLPKEGLKVDSDITLMALKSKLGIDLDYTDSGKAIITRNGEPVKNETTLEPVDAFSFVTEQLTALDLISKSKTASSEDDDNTGGNSEGSYDKFVKRMEASNISEGSMEFNEKMQSEINDGTLKL